MTENKENTFFTKAAYDTEIALDVNGDVLERIYKSNVSAENKLPIEFFFVSDDVDKLKRLGLHLLAELPDYTNFEIQPYQDKFELLGTTSPIRMELGIVNEWNQKMWDIGYQFDCKLDGWQVEHLD